MENSNFLIYSKINGVYLGTAQDLAIWSGINPSNMTESIVFDSMFHAYEQVSKLGCKDELQDVEFIPVLTSNKFFATIEEVMMAGLPAWTS